MNTGGDGLPEYRQINVSIFFSELQGKKVTRGRTRIGLLSDLVIIETPRCPEVTHFVVSRPRGRSLLLIPWDRILSVHGPSIELVPDCAEEECTGEPVQGQITLIRYILDKKVIDLEDHEIKVVRDLHLIINMFNRLLVYEVDFSRAGRLRRYGLSWLSIILPGGEEAGAGLVPWADVQLLPSGEGETPSRFSIRTLKENLSRMHPVDIAEIIEDMDQDQRAVVFSELDPETASDTLEEIAPPIQREIVSVLTREKAVEVLDEMTPGQAADILSVISCADADAILDVMRDEKAKKVRSILEKSEDNILNYTTSRFIMVPPDTRVREVRDDYPRLGRDKDVIMYLYIVDDSDILRGVVDIKELLQADDDASMLEIMVDEIIVLNPESTLKEAAGEFARYDFRALPVVDADEKIIGVVPYRDIMRLRRNALE